MTVYKVNLTLALVVMVMVASTAAAVVATTEDDSRNAGEPCRFNNKTGQWTDISQCPTAFAYLTVSPRLRPLIDDLDMLVCCERHNIVTMEGCAEQYKHFEVVRIDNVDDTTNYVTLMKVCDQPVEGDACTVGQRTGTWTNEVGVCEAAGHRTPDGGCCKLPSISGHKCDELLRRATTTTTTAAAPVNCNEAGNGRFLARFYNDNKSEVRYTAGVLISQTFILTIAQYLYTYRMFAVGFVRVGTDPATPFVAVAEHITHPNFLDEDRNNVGLVRLATAVTFDAHTWPACLPRTAVMADGQHTAIGWSDSGAAVASVEKVIPIDVATFKELFLSADVAQHFGVQRKVARICRYSRGSPLVTIEVAAQSSCTATVLAINAGSHLCVHQRYVRVYPFVDWIEAVIWSSDGQ